MKFNKITLILSIFIVLLSIGSVNASEDITDFNQGTDIVDEINNPNGVSTYDLNVEPTVYQANNTTNTEIIVKDADKYYNNDTPLIVELVDENGTGIANENITITINNKSYVFTTDENGTVSMGIGLFPGVYEYTVTYKGSDIYNSSIANATFTVLPTIDSENVTKFYRNGTHYYATYLDKQGKPIAGAKVTFNINGKFYDALTDANGTAMLEINLFPGVYILTTENPADDLKMSYTITVIASINSSNVTKYYRNDTHYYATFYDYEGNPLNNTTVSFNINGKFYDALTDANGTAMLAINLNPGKYILTTENPNDGLKGSYMIEVLSTLIVKDQTFKYNLSENGLHGRYSVKVVDGQGKAVSNVTVTLNINGVFYDVTTDSNGTAYLDIRLNPGTYVISATYGDLTVSSKVTVSKISATLKVLTSSVKSGEQFKVEVKITETGAPAAGIPIFFIFEDDDTAYRVLTNSEGIAAIKIYAKPGSYQIISAIQNHPFYTDTANIGQVKITS